VRIAVATLIAVCALTACAGGGTAGGAPSPTGTASSPSTTSSPSSRPSAIPSPAGEPFTTQLTCGRPVTATHDLALYALATTPPILEVLDVSNPLKPALLCLLSPAQGGSFDQAPNQVVFWIGDQLGTADLSSGKVVRTERLPAPAFVGVFSRDGTTFAYRTSIDAAGSISTRIDGAGYDRELYLQAPIGGHGGPPPGRGPFDQLEFSADGQELLDFNEFRPASGPANFRVYRIHGILGSYAPPDSFILMQSTWAEFGTWSPTGHTLYFYGPGPDPSAGQLQSLDGTGNVQTVATGVSSLFWARVAPTGGSIIYDSYLSPPTDSCGGLPHLWNFDLVTHVAAQLSGTISSEPVVITRTSVWSNEEKAGQCGPGGESYLDGVILARDTTTGRDSVVNMEAIIPGIGGPPLPPSTTARVLDVWF
jgi:hypothetical protein